MGADRGDLRADVEVQELEAIEHASASRSRSTARTISHRGQAELARGRRSIRPICQRPWWSAARARRGGADAELARRHDDQLELAKRSTTMIGRASKTLREQRRLDVVASL